MNKDKLVEVFDKNALAYDRYRPGYPAEIVEKLIALSEMKASDKILEIGCGTGQITTDFLNRGYAVTAIEKGSALAQIVRAKMEAIGIGEVVNTAFEDWLSQEHFKLVISAQAFHWIDKAYGISKITDVLEEQGSIGLIWNIDQSEHTAFWQKTNPIYQKYLPALGTAKGIQETISEHWEYLKQQKDLNGFQRIEQVWEKTYSKEQYLGLLRTFSPHMSLQADSRDAFFREISTLIENDQNKVTRHYKTVLLFATIAK